MTSTTQKMLKIVMKNVGWSSKIKKGAKSTRKKKGRDFLISPTGLIIAIQELRQPLPKNKPRRMLLNKLRRMPRLPLPKKERTRRELRKRRFRSRRMKRKPKKRRNSKNRKI